jgi:hypothetical protein
MTCSVLDPFFLGLFASFVPSGRIYHPKVHLAHGMSYPISSQVKTGYCGHEDVDHDMVPAAPAVFRFTSVADPERQPRVRVSWPRHVRLVPVAVVAAVVVVVVVVVEVVVTSIRRQIMMREHGWRTKYWNCVTCCRCPWGCRIWAIRKMIFPLWWKERFYNTESPRLVPDQWDGRNLNCSFLMPWKHKYSETSASATRVNAAL